ncbi:hypothetical protein [Dyadobacter sediminis]|uniref:Uncharacterized protein n=1 Tax=Dyadobacter sediminis TaxID=1493691 RepID=A0A5R9KC14_9BACT|nr:hypothetical protein [Dyadobacter sediminis]TLU92356.1 hypothetical protein FEM55_16675 [Dyadobacter sediminis]
MQIRNTRSYLNTGNPFFLFSQPETEIPYPDPARLKSLLDDKIIVSILPLLHEQSRFQNTEKSPLRTNKKRKSTPMH